MIISITDSVINENIPPIYYHGRFVATGRRSAKPLRPPLATVCFFGSMKRTNSTLSNGYIRWHENQALEVEFLRDRRGRSLAGARPSLQTTFPIECYSDDSLTVRCMSPGAADESPVGEGRPAKISSLVYMSRSAPADLTSTEFREF